MQVKIFKPLKIPNFFPYSLSSIFLHCRPPTTSSPHGSRRRPHSPRVTLPIASHLMSSSAGSQSLSGYLCLYETTSLALGNPSITDLDWHQILGHPRPGDAGVGFDNIRLEREKKTKTLGIDPRHLMGLNLQWWIVNFIRVNPLYLEDFYPITTSENHLILSYCDFESMCHYCMTRLKLRQICNTASQL